MALPEVTKHLPICSAKKEIGEKALQKLTR